MDAGRENDRKMLQGMEKEELIDLLFLQMRNLWAVDGLYYLGIEAQHGTENATGIDADVWNLMGKIEARRLQKELGKRGDTVKEIMDALRLTSWALDLEEKEVQIVGEEAYLGVINCRTQNTRVGKGLPVFPCKKVRWNYLKTFANTMNPKAKVDCVHCPPDDRNGDEWCRWRLYLE